MMGSVDGGALICLGFYHSRAEGFVEHDKVNPTPNAALEGLLAAAAEV
jgi:hypothetical protein